ncbi:MAG: GAF domain-containing protein [Anaerolineae bacterium]
MTAQLWDTIIALTSLALFLSLGVYVVSQNPRRRLNWVFAMFCGCWVVYYVTRLALFSPQPITSATLFWFRLRWAAVALVMPALFHFSSYYFPPAIQGIRRVTLILIYVISVWLAALSLTSTLIVASAEDHPGLVMKYVPGDLAPLYHFTILVVYLFSLNGLVLGYRYAQRPVVKRQLVRILLPTFAGLAATLVLNVTSASFPEPVPHQFADLLLVMMAFGYAWAIAQHGAIVEQPLPRRDFIYLALLVSLSVAVLWLSFLLDQQLAGNFLVPLPFVTIIAAVSITTMLFVTQSHVLPTLEKLFFKERYEQRLTIGQLSQGLGAGANLNRTLIEMLDLLYRLLEVTGGFVAVRDQTGSPQEGAGFKVYVSRGKISPQKNSQFALPQPLPDTPLFRSEHQKPDQELPPPLAALGEAGLVYPLLYGDRVNGLLVLGEKRNAAAYSGEEIALCSELASQLAVAIEMMHLRRFQARLVRETQAKSAEIQQLQNQLEQAAQRVVERLDADSSLRPAQAELTIQLFGPLLVYRNGKLIPEDAWGSEKAKTLLAFLLWRGAGGATRDQIIEALWPDKSLDSAANVFHVTLYNLRRALEPDLKRGKDSRYILYSANRYRFAFDAPHQLDITEVKSWLEQADRLEQTGDIDRARELRRRSLESTHGDFMADIDFARNSSLEAEREWWRRLLDNTRQKLLEA